MHVGDAAASLARIRIVTRDDGPIAFLSDRIGWNLAQVTGAYQIVERLRQLAFVGRVLIDEVAQLMQVVLSTVSRACMMVRWYCGSATAARMMMIEITIISSSSVKPRSVSSER